jgi:integrase
MIVRMGDDIRACRDRAMILLAFAGALRRSELCELRREDVKFSNDGMRITVRRAKTDQEGTGSTVAVARGQRPETCPERNLRDWIDRAEIEFGPLFRKIGSTGQLEYEAMTPGAFAKILKARAAAAGVKGTDLEPISPHGLRAGLITEAYRNGAREADIQRHARHSDPRTTRGYVRAEEAMVSTPTKKTGL